MHPQQTFQWPVLLIANFVFSHKENKDKLHELVTEKAYSVSKIYHNYSNLNNKILNLCYVNQFTRTHIEISYFFHLIVGSDILRHLTFHDGNTILDCAKLLRKIAPLPWKEIIVYCVC